MASSSGGYGGASPSKGESATPIKLAINPRDTNRHYYYRFVRTEKWGDYKKVKTLRDAIHGKVILYETPDGQAVVGKKMRTANVMEYKNYPANELHYLCMLHQQAQQRGGSVTAMQGMSAVEDALNEIGVISYLNRESTSRVCQHVPQLYGVHTDADCIYLASEYCSGGEFFERIPKGVGVPEQEAKRFAKQILQSVKELHSEQVGHRDISLENFVLKDRTPEMRYCDRLPLDESDLRLIDFGQAVRLRSDDGNTELRYFLPCGKKAYRAPEMYLPYGGRPFVYECPIGGAGTVMRVLVSDNDFKPTCDADGKPIRWDPVTANRAVHIQFPSDAEEGQRCTVEQCGYAAAPADMFSCGVCIFILAFGIFPWEHAQSFDATYKWIQTKEKKGDNGYEALINSHLKRGSRQTGPLSREGMSLIQALLKEDPGSRMTAENALEHPWFNT